MDLGMSGTSILAKYIMGVHEVSRNHSGTDPACNFKPFYIKGNDNHQIGTGFFTHKGITSSVKTAEFTV